MKTIAKITLATVATAMIGLSANAAVTYGANNQGQFYVGAKVGQVDADLDNADNATTYGVYGGYNFDQNFGVEAEFQTSEDSDFNVGAANYEYNTKAYGAYGTYRYHFNNTPFYAKGKLGVGHTEVETKGTNVSYSSDSSKTSLAGGVGLGYQPTSNFGLEAGYNYLSGDANGWAIGAHLLF